MTRFILMSLLLALPALGASPVWFCTREENIHSVEVGEGKLYVAGYSTISELDPASGVVLRAFMPDNPHGSWSITSIAVGAGGVKFGRMNDYEMIGDVWNWAVSIGDPNHQFEYQMRLAVYNSPVRAVAFSKGQTAAGLWNGSVVYPGLGIVIPFGNQPIFRIASRRDGECGFITHSGRPYGYARCVNCDTNIQFGQLVSRDWALAVASSPTGEWAVAPLDYVWHTNRADYYVRRGIGTQLRTPLGPFENFVYGIDYSADGQLIACIQGATDFPLARPTVVTVWDAQGQKLVTMPDVPGPISNVRWVGTNLLYAVGRDVRLVTTNTSLPLPPPIPLPPSLPPKPGKGRNK